MLTSRSSRKSTVLGFGWLLVGGALMWLAAGIVLELTPRRSTANANAINKREPVDKRPSVASLGLNEMLKRAQRNHPSIRVAEARLASARAELDQARLQVANEVIETRTQWRASSAKLAAAKAELQAVEQAKGSTPAGKYRQMIESANGRLKTAGEQVAAVEARLALLIGKASADGNKSEGQSERNKVLRKLRSFAQQMVKVARAEWRGGKANPMQLFITARRLARIDIALAGSKATKRASIEAYVKTLDDLKKIAMRLYRAGKASQADILSIQYAIAEAELWKLDAK